VRTSKTHSGTTLLEIMLVLAIFGLMFIFGIRLYQSYVNTLQLRDLKYNVDSLFEAANSFYHANCVSGDISPTPPNFMSLFLWNTGRVAYPPTAPYPVSIAVNLLDPGYLDYQNWYPANPNVDPTGGESGYIVQLNPIVSTVPIPVNACVVTTPGKACLPITSANIASPNTAYSEASGTTIPTAQAQVVTWTVQVAVKITPASKVGADAAMLGADCISSTSSSNTVTPCSAGPSGQQYLVWSRTPSAALQKPTLFSTSMALLRQYNLMYTHDQNYEMNAGYSATTSPAQAPVYYLCGG